MAPPVHPDVAPLAWLLGTWVGDGTGRYPTVEPFAYREEVTFAHVGKPFLAYAQRTWHNDDGRPLHAETGFWRLNGGDRVEVVLAHPTGVVEIEEGRLGADGDTHVIELVATSVACTPSAKKVTALARRLRSTANEIRYELDLGAVGQPLQVHLQATLRKEAIG
jgi:hypothetical protein